MDGLVTLTGNPSVLVRVLLAVLVLAALAALWLHLRQRRALATQRLALQRLLQAEHDRREQEVAQRTAQLTELAQHLQTAREDERNRLARDLHDELGALLTSARLDAARIRPRLVGTAPQALERLDHLVDTLNEVVALKRRITEGLLPSSLGHLGLAATLDILAREFSERSGVQVHCSLQPVALAPTAELVVYRLVQEALNNTAKHARAHQVWIELGGGAGAVEVSVRDDGVGFDPATPRKGALGLVGMRYRVEAEGGTLAIVAAPGQGTRIHVTLPSAQAPPAEAAAHGR